MKAVVQECYGLPDEVLSLREIANPVPKDDEVLVRVRASSMNPDIWHAITGTPYILRLFGIGLGRPKNPIPGLDVAGIVEAVGKQVTRIKIGDEIFGEAPSGNINWGNCGTFAEYVCVPETNMALKPKNVSFEQAAAAATSGYIALIALRPFGDFESHHKILVNGAGGGVGTIVVQLAKSRGAHVTAIDSAEKLDMLRSLGADEVIDYRRENFFDRDKRYDLIVDVASNLSFFECRKRALTATGVYMPIGHDNYGEHGKLIIGPVIPRAFGLLFLYIFDRSLPRLKPSFPIPSKGVIMEQVRQLLESRTLTPFIDKTYPLNEVREALRYMRAGHARGRVVITP